MLSEEKNRELCNLLEIRPVYHLWVNFGDLDNDIRLVTNKRKYRLIADYRWDADDENLYDLKADLYPDMTLPSNFVKLLNLLLFNSCEIKFISDIKAEQQMLEIICDNGVSEDIKQQAQQIKWNYEGE